MHELARVTLQNEMDLILAHKRSMRMAELAGLSLSAQTTFATAVSEVSRHAIESEKGGCLILSVETDSRDKYIVACLQDEQLSDAKENEGLQYADQIISTAQKSYANGDMSYWSYISFLNQAIDIKKQNAEATNAYNQSAIQLQFPSIPNK